MSVKRIVDGILQEDSSTVHYTIVVNFDVLRKEIEGSYKQWGHNPEAYVEKIAEVIKQRLTVQGTGHPSFDLKNVNVRIGY